MTVESVTQAVSNLALQFGEEDADPGAMVSHTAHLHAEIFIYSNLKSMDFLMFDGVHVN